MSIRDIQIIQQAKDAQLEPVRTFTPAVLVFVNSANSDAKVDGKPDYCWASEFNQPQSTFQILNRATSPTVGLQVKIGYPEKPPFERQVIGIWDEMYLLAGYEEGDGGAVNSHPHAQSHQYPSEDSPGTDPVTIFQPAMAMLKTTGNGTNLTVSTQALDSYRYQNTHKDFPGAQTDLTASVPSTVSYVRYVLVYLDAPSSTLQIVEGTAVPNTGAITIPKPPLPGNGIASAYVKLVNAQTVITTADDIIDAREFLEPKLDGADIGGATEEGQILYSQDGVTFAPGLPMVNSFGEVMTNDDGIIIIV